MKGASVMRVWSY